MIVSYLNDEAFALRITRSWVQIRAKYMCLSSWWMQEFEKGSVEDIVKLELQRHLADSLDDTEGS